MSIAQALVLALVASSVAAAPVHAQSAEPGPNIAGQWTFTANVPEACSFGGTATLWHHYDNRYRVELTARQSCPALEDDFIVRQDCEASRLGDQVSVQCRIVEFVNGFDSPSYYPDNFTLTVASVDRMHGALISAGPARPAEWKRTEGAIS